MIREEIMKVSTFAEWVRMGGVSREWMRWIQERFPRWIEGQKVGRPLTEFVGRFSELEWIGRHVDGEYGMGRR